MVKLDINEKLHFTTIHLHLTFNYLHIITINKQ